VKICSGGLRHHLLRALDKFARAEVRRPKSEVRNPHQFPARQQDFKSR
jgi:hypothetical protein